MTEHSNNWVRQFLIRIGKVFLCLFAGVVVCLSLNSREAYANKIEYVEDEGVSTTTSTTFQTKATMTFTPTATGDYLIVASAELQGSATNESALARLLQGSGTVHANFVGEPDESGIYIHHFASHRIVNLTAGVARTFSLQYASESSMTVSIRRARIVALPLDTFSSNEGATAALGSTAYTTVATISFTPATAQPYLLLASAEYQPNSTSQSIIVEAFDGQTSMGQLNSEAQDTTDELHFFAAKIRNLPASAQQLRIRARNEGATSHSVARPRVAAIPLTSNLMLSQNSITNAYATNNSTTYADRATLSFTPSATQKYYVISSALTGGTATDGSTNNTESDLDYKGTETNFLQQGYQDDTDRLSFASMREMSLSSTTVETFKLRVKENTAATPDAGMGNASINAIAEDYNITGTVYTNEGVTNIGSGKTVSISVNGANAIASEDTNASGQYKLRVPDATTAGAVLTVYLDDETENGVTVTVTDGNDLTLDIYQDRLIVRHDNAGSLTNDNLDTANNNADTDISAVYTMTGADKLLMASGIELFIWTGDTYAPGAVISADDLDINGTLTLGSNSVGLIGDWDATGGTFTSSGTVYFRGIADQTITSNSNSFTDIVINNTGSSGSDDIILVGNLDINDDITITDGDLDPNTNNVNITIAGDWNMGASGSLDAGAGTETVTLDGTDQAINGSTTFRNLIKSETTNNSTDVTLTIEQSTTQTITGTLNLDGLDTDDRLNLVSSSTVTRFTFDVTGADQNTSWLDVSDSQTSTNDIFTSFSVDNNNTDSGEASPHWVFQTNYYWVGIVDGDLTSQDSNWATAAGACGTGGAGTPGPTDVAVFHSSCVSAATVDAFFNVGGLTIQSGYTAEIIPNSGIIMDIDGLLSMADGTLSLDANNTDIRISGNFTKTGGSFNAGSGTVRFDGTLSINVNSGTNLGRVLIDGANISVTLGSDVTVSSLTVASGDSLVTNGYELSIQGALDLNGTLNATNGAAGSSTVYIGGNWDMTGGTFTNTNSTVEFNGSSLTRTVTSDGESFYNLRMNGTGAWTLQDAMDVNGNLTIDTGALDANTVGSHTINVAGNWDRNSTFRARNGVVIFDGTSAQTVSQGSAAFNDVTVTNDSAVVTFNEAFSVVDFTAQMGGTSMKFLQSDTVTVTGTLNIDGALGDEIVIDSTDSTNQFYFNVDSEQTVSFVNVSRSNAEDFDIIAQSSTNGGGNDDATPSPHWVFPNGDADFMFPDRGIPGVPVVVQFVGQGFSSESNVSTTSTDIVVGPILVADTAGTVAISNGRILMAPFFIDREASTQTVTVNIDGNDVPQTFKIVRPSTGDGDFTGQSGTLTLGDNGSTRGQRSNMGAIVLDNLIVPSGLTVDVYTGDTDSTTAGNQGYLPVMIIVDGRVDIDGVLTVNGSAGTASVSGEIGGGGGAGGPGGGGGGAGGGDDAAQNDGGAGFSGGGGGSCDSDNASCAESDGGAGSGAAGGGASAPTAGTGGASIVTSLTGGTGGTGDTTDGAGGGGGSGFVFGSSGAGASDPATNGAGGSGGGGAAFDAGGGGGGFATVGTDGAASTGGDIHSVSHLVPITGGSGGGGGGSISNSTGGGGGGGGGAVIIYSTGNMVIRGTVSANGGTGGNGGNGGGGGGSGGSIILQSREISLGSAVLSAVGGSGGTATSNGGAGGDGRVRVDGEAATISGTVSGSASEFVGPAITSITGRIIFGTATASADIDVYVSDGTTTDTYSTTANGSGNWNVSVGFHSGTNYITAVQETSSGNVRVMGSSSLRQIQLLKGSVMVVD